jgi:hypothetical protein
MPTWVESTETGEYLLTSNFDPFITAEDEKALNALEWGKLGLYRSDLTLINGGQANETRDRNLKPCDIAYLKS